MRPYTRSPSPEAHGGSTCCAASDQGTGVPNLHGGKHVWWTARPGLGQWPELQLEGRDEECLLEGLAIVTTSGDAAPHWLRLDRIATPHPELNWNPPGSHVLDHLERPRRKSQKVEAAFWAAQEGGCNPG